MTHIRSPAAAPAAPGRGKPKQPDAAPAITRADRAADQVYRHLRRAILQGDMAPGLRLREVELAATLAVSRTPVREAISRLVGDRLVRQLPAGGVEVADITTELHEIYVIREALECCAGRLAAQRIRPPALAALEAALRQAEATDHTHVRRRARLNEDFHLTIAAAAESPRLAELIGEFREFFLNPRWVNRQGPEQGRQALQEHRQIIEALRAHDPDKAEQAIRQHLKRSYRTLLGPPPAEVPAQPKPSRRRAA